MNDLWRLSATDLAALIRDRKVSAKQAALAGLARLDAVNPAINAVVEHRPEDVLAQAEAIDAAIARGDAVGPLAGVPVTVKVNIDYAGYATTNGVGIQSNVLPVSNSPVIDNLRKAGAVILGRTNCPAFSYRWFTSNLLYGDTKNPRDPSITPGGSSGGAAASVAAGIGHIAHGTDIAGSIRYPAYACGVHGLRPTLGRIAAYNAALPERIISGQITAMSGPLARTIADVRLGLEVMSQPDMRDPWWVPAPLDGPVMPKRAAMVLRPDGLEITADVEAAVRDAGRRVQAAGWVVEEVDNTPALREAAELQTTIWFGDGYQGMLDAAEREGDPGALACLRGIRPKLEGFEQGGLSRAMVRRSSFVRDWQMFLQHYAVVLMPVSGELPFPDQLDLKDEASFARVWAAQMPQIGIPFMGLPALSVATGLVGRVPTGVQIVASRYREDLCLAAGEAIEAGGTPVSPIDPVTA
ncbi:amidase [Tardiphaga sp. vice352]|uniref:amidase family protein n=1 Tax=unclassified Tardiphaga TaxID=2631404 RepID=UPI001164353E|nr:MULTISPECIES: amidase family protein [unclassified Tardiphaga]QDM16173.1 amidase [Tardiphaga sp. vice278]QDM21200.1 amidase [Tardiphaga sp. vice154]QDM26382.1 amidase [Tardiphaga sp. vice304]QDM31450.1 amidase [Tardiphaga sp. vice352]